MGTYITFNNTVFKVQAYPHCEEPQIRVMVTQVTPSDRRAEQIFELDMTGLLTLIEKGE